MNTLKFAHVYDSVTSQQLFFDRGSITRDGSEGVFNLNGQIYVKKLVYSAFDTTPTPTPTTTVRFEVNRDAWGFENGSYVITWDNFRSAFGDEQTMNADGSQSLLADEEFKKSGYKSKAVGGMCFGYNLTAAKLYADIPTGFSLPASVSSYDKVNAVPGPFRLLGFLQTGDVSNYLAQYFLYQFGKEYGDAFFQNLDLSNDQLITAIKNSVDGNLADPLMLDLKFVQANSLPLINSCVGHVVTPYKYQEVTDGLDVWVYDSEDPNIEKKMHIGNDGNWSYDQWDSSQTCYMSLWKEITQKEFFSPVMAAIPASSFAGRIPTLMTSPEGPQISSLELNNVSTPLQNGLQLFIPAAGTSEVLTDTHFTFIMSGTANFEGTVYYTDTTQASVGLFSGGSVLSIEAEQPAFGKSDSVSMNGPTARIAITTTANLTRSLQTIIDQTDGTEQASTLTCSFAENALQMQSTEVNTVLSTTNALEACRFVVAETGRVTLNYVLPELPAGSTITLTVQNGQDSLLLAEVDTDGDGITDSTTLVPHESKPNMLFLPLVTR